MARRACDGCSKRKVKCDGDSESPYTPCKKCVNAGIRCTFVRNLKKGGPRKPSAKTIAAIKQLQNEFFQDVSTKQATDAHLDRHTTEEEMTDPESSEESASRAFQGAYRPMSGFFSHGTECYCLEGANAPTTYPIEILSQYLQIYHERLYPVWPVVKWQTLLSDLENNPSDPEIYALATSLASAVMGQLQLEQETVEYFDENTQTTRSMIVSTDHFAAEALRARRMFEWRDRPNFRALLTSLFFHVYYENRGNKSSSSLGLREAVTFVQTMELHVEATYGSMPPEEAEFKRRLFWLLFVTEKGHMVVHKLPSVLSPSIQRPNPDTNKEPVLAGFVNLVNLFINFDRSVIETWLDGDIDKSPSRNHLQFLQEQLSGVNPHETHTNDVQKADILVTKHWMRSLTWRVAARKYNLGRVGSGEDDAMTIEFPVKVAKDLLNTVSKISRKAIESHGPGMQSKLLEIAASLADVICIVPEIQGLRTSTYLHTANAWILGPLDFLIGMVKLTNFRSSSQSAQLDLIIEKTSGLLYASDPTNHRYPNMKDILEREYPPWKGPSSSPESSPSPPFTAANIGNVGRIIGEDIEEESIDSGMIQEPCLVDQEPVALPLVAVTHGVNNLAISPNLAFQIYNDGITMPGPSLAFSVSSEDTMDFTTSSSSYASTTPPGTAALNSPQHGSPQYVDTFGTMQTHPGMFGPGMYGVGDPPLGMMYDDSQLDVDAAYTTGSASENGHGPPLDEALLYAVGGDGIGTGVDYITMGYAPALSHHGSESESSERVLRV